MTPVNLLTHAQTCTQTRSGRKYKDATLLNEFRKMEMSHDLDGHSDSEQLIDANGAAATPTSSTIVISDQDYQQENDISSDEEEIDTGNYRP